MRFKVDENLHDDIAEALRSKGHDAVTVHDQHMRGDPDSRLGEVCRAEGRAIVSLDLDFANVRDYPPEDYPGVDRAAAGRPKPSLRLADLRLGSRSARS
jgi:Domain of unknown function (DUF5615)